MQPAPAPALYRALRPESKRSSGGIPRTSIQSKLEATQG
jgi:hypothetical protein